MYKKCAKGRLLYKGTFGTDEDRDGLSENEKKKEKEND